MNVAVMGYGTIGAGVVTILNENADVITKRCGFPITLKKVLDIRDFSNDPVIGNKVTADYKEIVNDPEIDIVVETMGGVEPAFTFVKAMLLAGKHVTTSNKALVAAKGDELMAIAKEKNVNFLFEASVGGGIPIIRPLATNISGDKIDLIEGIVNGTTNYILSRMKDASLAFDVALSEAQEKGYAEKDPTNDIDGFDATRKIAILTSIASGKKVDFEEIETEGIRNITLEDFKYAAALDREIKLIARAKREGDTYEMRVAPYMIEKSHPLSFVSDVFNAIFVRGNMLGDSMFYGSGAGMLPTASAVVGDIIDMARNVEKNLYTLWNDEKLKLSDPQVSLCSFLIRAKGDGIQKALPGGEIIDAGIAGEIGYLTAPVSEKELKEVVSDNSEVISYIRVR